MQLDVGIELAPDSRAQVPEEVRQISPIDHHKLARQADCEAHVPQAATFERAVAARTRRSSQGQVHPTWQILQGAHGLPNG
jgi:hypothetical protein